MSNRWNLRTCFHSQKPLGTRQSNLGSAKDTDLRNGATWVKTTFPYFQARNPEIRVELPKKNTFSKCLVQQPTPKKWVATDIQCRQHHPPAFGVPSRSPPLQTWVNQPSFHGPGPASFFGTSKKKTNTFFEVEFFGGRILRLVVFVSEKWKVWNHLL